MSAAAVLGVAAVLIVATLAGCSDDDPSARPAAGLLVEAAARGDADRVARLLRQGADVNERDADGRTAVTAAAYAESPETVRVLVDAGADVNLQDGQRANAFLSVGETGNVEVLTEVLRGDPDVTLTNRFGGTALIPAADRGHVAMVRALLDHTEVDVNHVNDLGWTALLEAVLLGDGGERHQEIVQMLLANGADPTIADGEGITPLGHARRLGHRELERLLEQTP